MKRSPWLIMNNAVLFGECVIQRQKDAADLSVHRCKTVNRQKDALPGNYLWQCVFEFEEAR